MTANRKEKYINLIIIHIVVLCAISLIAYVVKDAEEIRKRQEECEKRCYPAKPVKTLSVRHCMCIEELVDKLEEVE